MFLEDLPNELLAMLVRRLSPPDRFSIRKISPRFRDLVDSEDIFPENPKRIAIDFVNEAIFVTCGTFGDFNSVLVLNGRNVNISNSGLVLNGQNVKQINNSGELLNPVFFRAPIEVVCNVGNNWGKYVEKYVRKLNRLYGQRTVLENLVLLMPKDSTPTTVSRIAVKFNWVRIRTPQSSEPCEILPMPLEEWLKECLKNPRPRRIDFEYAISPRQLDKLSITRLSGYLTDEGALHILNKFVEGALPKLQCWILYVPPTCMRFLEELRILYGIRPEKWIARDSFRFRRSNQQSMKLVINPIRMDFQDIHPLDRKVAYDGGLRVILYGRSFMAF